ncbi:hypothetical protein [Candidatus Methanarcanum hacksteinii]|uniref:hypothetical protein n=1 Tax=Candidatus Methanarcanum hacksteinii TaxID=2911857 RepID=UPI0037DDBA0C
MSGIDSFRIYCEVYEQGVDIKDYIKIVEEKLSINSPVDLVYTTKKGSSTDNVVNRIITAKKTDLMITALSKDIECPLLVIEYSTAVPTDDHIMQRSDVLYWGSKYHVPSLKISPLNKRMGEDKNHGGGDKITEEFETFLAIKNQSPYYFIKWSSEEGREFLKQNHKRLSCIPFTDSLTCILHDLIKNYLVANSPSEYFSLTYSNYYEKHKDLLSKYSDKVIKSIFPNSSRLQWNNNTITVKINRFGHAMDPDRGIVYFMNMLLGRNSVISEMQIQRSGIEVRGGYKSLFDSIPKEKEMMDWAKNLVSSGNRVTSKMAAEVFFKSTNMDSLFDSLSWDGSKAHISDSALKNYLKTVVNLSHQYIFYLSKYLILTDQNRNILATITWNNQLTDECLSNLLSNNYSQTKVKRIVIKDVSEDLVTYSTVKVLEKAELKLAAVSYPGAQGDLCILIGEGRNVLREYVDVIAYREKEKIITRLMLQENKTELSQSKKDVEKLNDIKNNQLPELRKLMKKITEKESISAISIGLGAKKPDQMPHYDVDYIVTFGFADISSGSISWTVWISDTNLLEEFKLLKDPYGRISGVLHIDPISRII